MTYIELLGNSISEDIQTVKDTIEKDSSVVFVYSGEGTLYDYIDKLYDRGHGLDDEDLYRFKVCYEYRDEKSPLKMSYVSEKHRSREISSMKDLINELDGESKCRIIIESDERVQLAFVVQQLIYIEYPLETVDILLRKEEKDAAKTKRFMENIDDLWESCNKAYLDLSEMLGKVKAEEDDPIKNPTKESRIKDIYDTLESCVTIRYKIIEAQDEKMKIAVAASKKSGKSVIVNCFLGEEIAPTDTELATPNNCIYEKSDDQQYHLRLEGKDEEHSFAGRQEIHDVIEEYFRDAQRNQESGFSMPDMHIKYATDKNNFSSYTIYDTAGPDAAGTSHGAIADRAMHECDVAVFAIDYAKYLTKTEEEYLRSVKELFTKQGKFHTLMFALNKMDVRYTDTKVAKSFIKSVDFIKTRLACIAEDYKDCIIFPTSSLEYFCTLEAEKEAPELSQEPGVTRQEIEELSMKYRKSQAGDFLQWLNSHASGLRYYQNIENFTYETFRKDSGMPALMSYVSYVARSKAREEIVNNITHEIASQKVRIQGVLDSIHNIKELIDADDTKIDKITTIISEYADAVQKIFSENFTEDDFSALDTNSLLRTHKCYEGYELLIEHQKKAVKDSCDKDDLANRISEIAIEQIWRKIEDKQGKMTEAEIDNLLTAADFKKIIDILIPKLAEDNANATYKQLTRLGKEVAAIVKQRQDNLSAANADCKKRLSKENFTMVFPEIPEFEFAAKLNMPNHINLQIKGFDLNLNEKLQNLFKTKILSSILRQIKQRLTGSASKKDLVKVLRTISQEEFYTECSKNLKPTLENIVYKNHISEALSQYLTKTVIDGYMGELVHELQETFKRMNEIYLGCVRRFQGDIDDRDKYRKEIELYNIRMENISGINNHISDFMQVWDSIVNDMEENTIQEPEASVS